MTNQPTLPSPVTYQPILCPNPLRPPRTVSDDLVSTTVSEDLGPSTVSDDLGFTTKQTEKLRFPTELYSTMVSYDLDSNRDLL